jgi:hypothetical protein
MGDKDSDDSWTRGLWLQGEETVGKQKKTFWYKLEKSDPSFSTQVHIPLKCHIFTLNLTPQTNKQKH